MAQNVTCPHCSRDFFATPPEPSAAPILPERLPFFKSGRRKILEKRLEELVADGELDPNDDRELTYLTASLGLDQADLQKVRSKKFRQEFGVIKSRVESEFMLSDEDLAALKQIEKKYDVKLTLTGDFETLRAIYLMEVKKVLPQPIATGLMLTAEPVYFGTAATWQQTRVRSHGYSGVGMSIPTGIKGVRFHFGKYSPIKSEELTPLSDGILYVTSKRLLFHGTSRNTSINLTRVIDCEIFLDALKIEKSTGKPDYFSMHPAQSRYLVALLAALK